MSGDKLDEIYFPQNTEVDWYDFGGGELTADVLSKPGEKCMALYCVRNGKYFYETFSVEPGGNDNLDSETMDRLKREHGPALSAYADERKDGLESAYVRN